jgi:hypothetical protein
LASGLPCARTEFLHTTGHLPYLTHPHRIAKLTREFLLDEASLQNPEACRTLGAADDVPQGGRAER